MTKTAIPVNGMHCGGCEQTLQRALTRLDGVRAVKADRAAELVTVHYDPAQVDEESLRECIDLCGFEVVSS
jgi:Cu+-exporting ATPase